LTVVGNDGVVIAVDPESLFKVVDLVHGVDFVNVKDAP
jgi:hypothetical protein